jgi:dTDP-4-amino-4,6-dideoxygalactose transaminase
MSPPLGIHGAHLFYLLMPTWDAQGALIGHLANLGIVATFHYVPLDSSAAGRRYGRSLQPLTKSEDFSRRLVRLPLWAGMSDDQLERVVSGVRSFRVL